MTLTRSAFVQRYGPWAVVAGASEGLGAAFATGLAARGVNVLLLARRQAPMEALAQSLRERHRVEVKSAVVDLASPRLDAEVEAAVEQREIGLLVYNAGDSSVGPFLDWPAANHVRSIEVNCRGPVTLTHRFAAPMARRGRGGIILMTSLTGFQGSPYIAAYGATKAFNLSLAEALWFELGPQGVDVLGVCSGAIRTPNMLKASPDGAPGMLEPEQVAEHALEQLGRGPTTIPGSFNRVVSFVLRRFLPRRTAVSIMGRETAKLGRSPQP